jgi:60S ribosome subunit biogenesis protein NIP7
LHRQPRKKEKKKLKTVCCRSLSYFLQSVSPLWCCQYNTITMRPLTEEETKTLFLKLSEYIGKNIELMINRSDERHCFRLIKDRCYYISESIMRAATSISRDHLLHVGVCMGKFTKSGKFRLHVTALEYLSQYAKYKVWVKPSAEMSFLYGNHVNKQGLARMTENTPQYAGVVVYSMASDIPLGFGVAAQSTEHCQQLDPTGNVVLHQADIGEYLRGLEDEMF